jgi:hypothetical protein
MASIKGTQTSIVVCSLVFGCQKKRRKIDAALSNKTQTPTHSSQHTALNPTLATTTSTPQYATAVMWAVGLS